MESKVKKKLIVFLILSAVSLLLAEDLAISAYVNKNKIGIKDRFVLTLEISGENAGNLDFEFPEITNFRNYGVSQSSSSSISIVNGKMDKKGTKTYGATMMALTKGNLTIPSISLKYKGKLYKTNPIIINVVEGSLEEAVANANLGQSQGQGQGQGQKQNYSNKISDNLFIKQEISNHQPYIGEPVIISFYLYTRYDIRGLNYGKEQVFNGFWKEDLYIPKQFDINTTTQNGVKYNRMLLKTIAVFPAKSGRVTVDGVEYIAEIRTQPSSFFDFGNVKEYNVVSEPITFNIKDYPEEAPQSFNNAVGSFKLNSSVSQTELKVGESLTYTLEISGSGNINYLDPPILPEMKHLRFYEPEIKTELSNSKTGVSGKKTIKYLVLAQEEGEFQLPEIEFSYFDYNQKKFVTKKTKAYNLKVSPGEKGSVVYTGQAQSVIGLEGSDIQHIIEKISFNKDTVFFSSVLYWLILMIIFLTLPAAAIYATEQHKLSSNVDYVRQKQANKIIKKYLQVASDLAAKNDKEFYAAAQNGLNSYLTDKMKIPKGSLHEELFYTLERKIDDADLLLKIRQFFEKCNQKRFMPLSSVEDVPNDYKTLRQLVSEIYKMKIRTGK